MNKHFDYIAIGGTNVNVGCVPQKVIWHGAHITEAISQYAPDYGLDVKVDDFSWQRLTSNRSAYIDRLHEVYERGLAANKIDFIKGFSRITGPHSIEVNGKILTAEHIVIAKGGH